MRSPKKILIAATTTAAAVVAIATPFVMPSAGALNEDAGPGNSICVAKHSQQVHYIRLGGAFAKPYGCTRFETLVNGELREFEYLGTCGDEDIECDEDPFHELLGIQKIDIDDSKAHCILDGTNTDFYVDGPEPGDRGPACKVAK